jgi:hypothetical protein
MTNMVIQSQASWGVLDRVEKGKRVVRLASTVVENDELTVWLIEAALRYAGKPLVVSNLQSQPVLFPFNLTQSLAYLVSNSKQLILKPDGSGSRFVALCGAI